MALSFSQSSTHSLVKPCHKRNGHHETDMMGLQQKSDEAEPNV